MTIIIGVLCQVGAVVGADTSATTTDLRGGLVSRDTTEKIRVFEEQNCLYTHTGEGGAGQRIGEVVRLVAAKIKTDGTSNFSLIRDQFVERLPDAFSALVKGYTVAIRKAGITPSAADTARFLDDASKEEAGIIVLPAGDVAAVVAFEGTKRYWLLDEKFPYVVMGSGQGVGNPFLSFIRRVLWRGSIPNVDDAVLGVLWTLKHAIKHVAFGVGGEPHIGVLRRDAQGVWSVQRLSLEDFDAPLQLIDDIETAINGIGHAAVAPENQPPIPGEAPPEGAAGCSPG